MQELVDKFLVDLAHAAQKNHTVDILDILYHLRTTIDFQIKEINEE